ncbi:MAG: TauD/TfdA family dioxygenase [Ideonella sp.]|nr:TauD/TfdA family dioxygenase [Ideonella sp.]
MSRPKPWPAQPTPFELDDEASYRRWREAKLAACPASVDELLVDIADPLALTSAERGAAAAPCRARTWRCTACTRGRTTRRAVVALGRQLGLRQLDANWLADEDGLSNITQSDQTDGRGGFIPYTDRPINWHTDGYYHPQERRIRGMVLHCARPAREGGVNALLDPELAYIALRDASPEQVRALMAPDAMTIPERRDPIEDGSGVARPAQAGPVFSVNDGDGTLHMRYTARTRSIEWKTDAATRAAVASLARLLASDSAPIWRVRMEAGMGLVSHNVLHDRSGFRDDAAQPRLLYRARYLDRSLAPELAWR